MLSIRRVPFFVWTRVSPGKQVLQVPPPLQAVLSQVEHAVHRPGTPVAHTELTPTPHCSWLVQLV
jgi:hypothetical protein